jgi:hypothetical protein
MPKPQNNVHNKMLYIQHNATSTFQKIKTKQVHRYALSQGCKNSGCKVVMDIQLCTAAPSICGSNTELEDRDSVVGLATRYRLDGQGIEFRWGKTLCTRPDRLWDQTSLLYYGYRVSLPRIHLPGRDTDHPPQSSLKVK